MSSSPVVFVEQLQTYVAVGIHPHEQIPQRLLVSVEVSGQFPEHPQSIDDCFNYEMIYRRVVVEWPQQLHVALLEMLAADLLAHVFAADARVEHVSVRIGKPDIYAEAAQVGVQMRWSREDYARYSPR